MINIKPGINQLLVKSFSQFVSQCAFPFLNKTTVLDLFNRMFAWFYIPNVKKHGNIQTKEFIGLSFGSLSGLNVRLLGRISNKEFA